VPRRSDGRPLSHEIADLLRHGDHFERYAEPWQAVIAVALGFVDCGWSRDAFLTAMFHPQNKCIETLRITKEKGRQRQRSITHVRKEVDRAWDKAVKYATRYPVIPRARETAATITSYRRRANAWHFPIRGGQRYRQALDAHFAIAERVGMLYTASVRDIAELAGVSIDSVQRAHRLLRREGWLRLEHGAPRHERKAAQWRLTAPTAEATTADALSRQSIPGGVTFPVHSLLSSPEENECTRSVTAAGRAGQVHDLWRAGGLGPKAGAVYAALPRTVGDLSRLLGIRRRSVYRHVARLRAHGLAKVVDGVWQKGEASLDVVAVEIGAAGLAEAQRKEHKRQRDRFDDQLERGGHRGRKGQA
jgi:DNA-binding transcriptional ArsR family regulator